MKRAAVKPNDFFRAIAFPFTSASVLVPVLVLWLLMSFARWGGVLGLFLMFLVMPAIFRLQMIVLEARALGREPPAMDVEFFNWIGNAWSLFPLPLFVLAGWLVLAAFDNFGTAAGWLVLFFAAIIMPAPLAILAITHSPLQSLNPVAIAHLLKESLATLWIASVYLFFAGWLSIQVETLPWMLANLIQMFLFVSFFSLVGSLIEPYGLIANVSIPDALEAGEEEIAADLEEARTRVLNHSYGFVSRGNREGGFAHIEERINTEQDVAAAWAWFFNRMMAWEQPQHALFFAQKYVHDMLKHGENIPALKVIMRCRLVDEEFHPFRDDLPAAVEAAERSGNIELAAVLKRV
ncbi:MAG: hypothetical protein QNM00_08640 [Gammaproteobacteria bacterium]|nr:hypothetical protein [Gammaproteobacteria bacterium]